MLHFLIGNLTWAALPHEWFTIGGTAALTVGALLVVVFLTYTKRWRWLWSQWLTSTNPKKIGVMYVIVAGVMLFRGGLDAGMIFLQQSLSVGASQGYLSPDHFQQIFTAHGTIMILFVTMGFLFGLMNFIIPLQIGARDVAFPLLNTLSFWLYVAGAIFINLFFAVGGAFAATGWLAMPPLSELAYSPGVGVDYWIWALQISGLGSLLSGINFLVTVVKMRAPGMTLMKMPMFAWTTLCSMILVISAFPILTITTILLYLDRSMGMHFFTATAGGNPMMYVNLIWSWGHPEVYILMIPAFGIYSEIVGTFSRKKLFGHTSLVVATIFITLMSMLVWLHHFFTMGAGADVNAFFGIMTMIIAIPTSVLIFNWIATMYRARINFSTPMYWFMGFVATFTFGGMAGVLLGLPGADYLLHNTLFLVAHFHTMVIGGALFGIFAGITYWFPKVVGFKLNERIGRWAFWAWIVGFFMSFVPLYILGIMGATRRMDHYDASTGFQPLFIIAGIGFLIICAAVALQVWQLIVSIRARRLPQNVDTTGDPWNGRTLEWATFSPPPIYNFAIVPEVTERDAWWEMKEKDLGRQKARPVSSVPKYEDITMPKNTAVGIYISGFAFLMGFGFVWHIIWMILLGLVGAIACVIIRSFDEETEYVIPASEVARIEANKIPYYE